MNSSATVREFALAQAALEHGVYFMELGAEQRAAAYFRFAAEHLHELSNQLLLVHSPSPLKTRATSQRWN